MKKMFTLISVFAALSPLAFADTNPTDPTTTALTVPAEKPKETTAEVDHYPWTKNISGNAAFVTNYVFRGVSQSHNLPAAQAGLTYTFPIGLYLSLWGSSVRFTDSTAFVEIDTVIGYHNTIGEDFAYDLSVARYNYPGEKIFNYNEFIALLSYFIVQASFGYSADVFATHQTGIYTSLGINYDIPERYFFNLSNVNLLATMGHYSLPRAAGNSYNDYSIQLAKTFNMYKFSVQWTNTDGRQHIAPYNSAQIIGQIAANFA